MKLGARLSKMRKLPMARGQTKLWQTMRVRRKQGAVWTAADLAALCDGIGPRAIAHYIRALRRVGYLVPGSARTWRLARDTGPEAPRVLKARSAAEPHGGPARIYDPNTGEIVVAGQPAQEAGP